MGHITSKNYLKLQKRLDDAAQGAPESNALYKILEILFTEEEAELVCVLPLKFFTIERASKLWKKSYNESKEILDELAAKGILLDFENKDEQNYVLAPTMAGFFEFSLMRTDGKFNTKVLSELFHEYINQEDDFVKRIFGNYTQADRVFLQEEVMPETSVILDYEKATHVIDTATCISVGRCYCRHKMEHAGGACDNPQNVCLTFNNSAKSLVKHKIAKQITKEEANKILDECVKLGLVQIGDNVQEGINWICNCCSCCCEAINAYKKLGYAPNLTSNFVCENNIYKCTACGICVKKCPVEAIEIENKENKNFAEVNQERCFGCGVCVRFCPTKSLGMIRKKEMQVVPKDTFERVISVAIDTGTLQNYIFDNYNLITHKFLRSLLGAIFALPPTKQLLANKQLRSKFIKKLIEMQ